MSNVLHSGTEYRNSKGESMSDRKHSWFPPSSAERSILCPASLLNSKRVGRADNGNNVYAEQGTECHDAMEQAVAFGMPSFNEDQFSNPKEQIELCEIAWAAIQSIFTQYEPDNVGLETEVNLKEFGFEDIFGTADVVAYNSVTRTLVIADYKFGYTPVDIERNAQLMTYGLAALSVYPEAEKIMLVVIQPKQEKNPMTYETSPLALRQWWDTTLSKAVYLSRLDDAPFEPGEKQCKFCDYGKAGCKAQAQKYIDAVQDLTPGDVNALSDDELAERMAWVPGIKDALKALEIACTERLKKGNAIRGYKLVRGDTKRKWGNADEAAAFLKKRFKQAEVFDQKIISPAAAEKLMKKKKVRATTMDEFKKLIVRPEGKITYAPLSDSRAPVGTSLKAAMEVSLIEDLL